MSTTTERNYLPAAGHHASLPLYDPFVRLLGGDAVRRTLLDLVSIGERDRVLDVGSGTGTFALEIKRRRPDAEVVGVDPDPSALASSRKKAERRGLRVRFDRGFGDALPFEDAAFDVVVSTMMFHHLDRKEKTETLGEIRRVLRPGGTLGLLDFSGPEAGRHGLLARLLHGSERLRDNEESRVVTMMAGAGFDDVRVVGHSAMLFGQARVTIYAATAPDPIG